jgi:hypothetical protein
MKRILIFLFLTSALALSVSCNKKLTVAPISPLLMNTPTSTIPLIPTGTHTPTSIPFTPTETNSQIPTDTLTPTDTDTPISTSTLTPTWTLSSTVTSIATSTSTPTRTNTPPPPITSTYTPTRTSTNTRTNTRTWTPTNTTTTTSTPTNTFTPNATATACSLNSSMGNTAPGTYKLTWTKYMLLNPYQAPYDTTFYELWAYVDPGTRFLLVLYASNAAGTAPTTLLARTGVITSTSLGWVNLPLDSLVPVTKWTYYWIGIALDSGSAYYVNYNADMNAGRYADPIEPPPATFGGWASGGGYLLSIYASGCPIPSPTPTPVGTWFTETLTPTKTRTKTPTPSPTCT